MFARSWNYCGPHYCLSVITLCSVIALILCALKTVHALEFTQGEWQGSFDSTVSLGMLYRTQDASPSLIDRHNGGTAQNALNGDDGDLNFDKGLVSAALKFTHELQVKYRQYGAFVRGSYFYDAILDRKSELSHNAKKYVAYDADMLDAYIFGLFEPRGRALDVRLGSQVVSWGESTFIPNGLNIINPVDITRFRVPGAEVREALIPTPMIWGSLQMTENVSIEALYLFRFRHVELDPRGSYFSTNDVISPDSDHLVAGFGIPDETGNIAGFTTLPNNNPVPDGAFLIGRNSDRDASDSGEYGLALRWFAPAINDTEFGFYYLNYHSRLPVVSFVAGNPFPPSSAKYFVEYPENIHLWGLSFNTISKSTGIALQGEVSYRENVPLQIELSEVAMAATHTPIAGDLANNGYASQLVPPGGSINSGDIIQGYKRMELTQVQMTATKAFGRSNPFKADQWTLLGEVGATKVFDMPDESELRFEAPGTNLPARSDIIVVGNTIPAQDGGFAEDFAWGYRLMTQAVYNSVVSAINLTPRFVFAHDVKGTAPVPGGNFVESRKAATAGLAASYMEKWSLDMSYTKFFGAEGHNPMADRDFVAMSVKYGF